jgi:hypothetical protein
MALLSKKEFAQRVGKDTKWLANYIGRGKVVCKKVGDKELIDTTNDKNKTFLEQYELTPFTASIIPPTQPDDYHTKKLQQIMDAPPDEESGMLLVDLNNIPPYQFSERLLKYLDTEKRKREIEKLEHDNEKKRGEVVPVEPIETLVFQFKQFILTQQKITYEKFLNEITHKYNIDAEDMANYRGFFIAELNASMKEASDNFVDSLDATLNEFTIKKGVGERS